MGGRTCPHIYLCYYFPVETGPDALSRSLIRFKYGISPDTGIWIECALAALKRLPRGTMILRALHHDERDPGIECTSLDALGREIALVCDGIYCPTLLGKRQVTVPFRDLHSKRLRVDELKGVYYIRGTVAADRILLIDDIVTTGTTVAAILKVLNAAWPKAKFLVFSLAKASPKRFH